MGRQRVGLFASFLLAVASAGLGLAPRTAAGANFLVDTTAVDLSDIAPGDGVCAWSTIVPEGERCSLRAAVAEANALAGADTVVIPTGFSITLSNGEIVITSPMAIGSLGVGATRPTIDANDASRIFKVMSVAGGAEVRFVNLVLRDGSALGENGFNTGGAILASNGSYELSIEGCDLLENVAGGGGALSTLNDSVRISDSVFWGNGLAVPDATVSPIGVAIWASGAAATLQIERSSILFNPESPLGWHGDCGELAGRASRREQHDQQQRRGWNLLRRHGSRPAQRDDRRQRRKQRVRHPDQRDRAGRGAERTQHDLRGQRRHELRLPEPRVDPRELRARRGRNLWLLPGRRHPGRRGRHARADSPTTAALPVSS